MKETAPTHAEDADSRASEQRTRSRAGILDPTADDPAPYIFHTVIDCGFRDVKLDEVARIAEYVRTFAQAAIVGTQVLWTQGARVVAHVLGACARDYFNEGTDRASKARKCTAGMRTVLRWHVANDGSSPGQYVCDHVGRWWLRTDRCAVVTRSLSTKSEVDAVALNFLGVKPL